MESSPESAITDNFNPYVSTGAATRSARLADLRAADAVRRRQAAEAAVQLARDRLHVGHGGKSITFTIRSGVKWIDGSPLTPADVAFTYNLLKKYADINTAGMPVTGPRRLGNT